MRIYLDVSCLNRPFDDQSQARIRIETAALTFVFDRIDAGQWSQVSSEMALIEAEAIENVERRNRVQMLLPGEKSIIKLTPAVFNRAADLEGFGFQPADAVHVAAAEQAGADVLLSCDDRLCRLAHRLQTSLNVVVANPTEWLKEIEEDADA